MESPRTGPEPFRDGEPPAPPSPTAPPRRPAARRLRRTRADRIIGGVCGGLGRYLDVDPVLIRIAAVALALSGGAGVLVYVVAWVLIPEAGAGGDDGREDGREDGRDDGEDPAWRPRPSDRHTVALVVGAGLVVAGVALLTRGVIPGLVGAVFWPLVVVVVGVLVILGARR